MGWTSTGIVVCFSAGTRNLSVLQTVQTSSGIHPASWSMGIYSNV